MNAWLKILAIVSVTALPLTAIADNGCDARLLASPTQFPMRSQLRGQEGVVALDLTIDAGGRVAQTEVVNSSGHRLLDRAAQESALRDWRFDVSDCTRGDLPINRRITVEYRNDEYR